MTEQITGPSIDDTAKGMAEVLVVDPEKIQVGPASLLADVVKSLSADVVVLNHAQARRLLVLASRTTADQLEREYARRADKLTPGERGVLALAVKVLRRAESPEDCPTEAVHVSLGDLFDCPKCGTWFKTDNQERAT